MKYIFRLSGEDLKLAKTEVQALFETYGLGFKARRSKDLLFVESKAIEKQISKLCKRSALLHWCSVVKDSSDFSWVRSPFMVRIKKGEKTEKKVASQIWRGLKKPSVDLENPKTTVYVVGNQITKLIWEKKKNRFNGRQPKQKPVFHPTSLKPKWARLIINLSRCKESCVLLDPFCGTGSVLIEAAIIGCKAIGSDLDKRMIKGAKKNLKHYGLHAKVQSKQSFAGSHHKVVLVKQANALELEKHYKKNSIDAIATDPPYGRSSRIGAKNIRELYEGFLKSAHKVLKTKKSKAFLGPKNSKNFLGKNKYCVLLYPHYVKFAIPKKWKVVDRASIYVHGGLTRKILVLRKV
ncbi:methyltransferase domain-containing protein [Candidatus Woesearchaeota archaeon]|nr:methyltransferase domain-containing protein [Candidatus Woesearchaeota archaeon]